MGPGKPRRRQRYLARAAFAGAAALPLVAAGTTYTYIGASGTDWATGFDWSPTGPPGAGATVNIIEASATPMFPVSYDYNYSSFATGISSLTLDSSTTFEVQFNQDTPSKNLFDGTEYVGFNGTAVHLQSASSNNISGTLYLGYNATAHGGYGMSGTGGVGPETLTANQIVVGNLGTGHFDLFGGTLTAGNGSNVAEQIGFANSGGFVQAGGTNQVNGGVVLGGAATGTGSYILNGGNLTISIDMGVGDTGVGTFNQTAGTCSVSQVLFVGTNGGSTGTFTLGGAGLLSAGFEDVGDDGKGTFNQAGGVHSITANLAVGVNPGSSGTFNLSGGSLGAAGEIIGVQNAAPDTALFAQTGGTNTIAGNGNLLIAQMPGSVGSYTIDTSAGPSMLTAGSIIVGYNGSGSFTHTAGSVTIANRLTLGYLGGSHGTYTLAGGTLTAGSAGPEMINELIGFGGTGTFVQSGGTHQVKGDTHLGGGVTGNGTYTLSGGQFTVNGNISVGDAGTGTFNHTGGALSVFQGLLVASNAGSIGTYYLSGPSTGAGASTVSAFFASIGNAGKGAFNQTGGSMTSNSQVEVGVLPGSTGAYTMDASTGASTLTTFLLFVGHKGAGTFVQNAGSVNVGTSLAVGISPGATGAYTLAGSAGTITTPLMFVGAEGGAGLFVQTAGSVAVNGLLTVGNFPGSTGTYSLAGGTLTSTSVATSIPEVIGYSGTGRMNQTGGTNQVTGDVRIAANAGGTGTYNLSGGLFNINGNIGIGHAAAGTLNQTGGTLAVSAGLYVGSTPGAIGTFDLGAGTVTAASEFVGADGDGTVNQSGGTNTASNSVTVQSGAGVGIYNLSGTGVLTANGTGLLNSGTFNLLGGTVNGAGPLVNQALMTGNGTIAGTGGFANNAVFNQRPGTLTIANTGGDTNTGTMNLAAGQSFVLSGITLANTGVVNLNGALVSGSGTLANNAGGTVAGFGNLASTGFTNAAGATLVAQGGNLQIANPFTNNGQITVTPGAVLGGGAITNAAAIQGAGTITSNINNTTGALEPVGGTLTLAGTISNSPQGVITTAGGSKLVLTAGLATNAATIELAGGVIDNNGHALSNTGTIDGYGVLRTGGLTNNGSITFAGGSTTLDDDLTNSAGKTVAITNTPALFTGNVTNAGTIKTTKTSLTILGTYTGQTGGTFNSDPADNYFNSNVSTQSGSAIVGGAGNRFFLSGGTFTNAGTYNVAGTLQTSDPIVNSGSFTQTGTVLASANFTNSGTTTIGGSQTWSAGTTFTNTGGAATFNSDAGAAGPALGFNITGGSVIFASTQHLSGLTLGGGTADLRNNTILLSYSGPSPAAAIGAAVAAGSLFSSLADANHSVGFADSADQVVAGLPANTVEVKYTVPGDANLDGVVDFSDLVILARNYGRKTAHWDQGDFNYDGSVGFDDLVTLARHYSQKLTPADLASFDPSFRSEVLAAFVTVPEPASVVVPICGVLVAMRRRRSCHSESPCRMKLSGTANAGVITVG